LKKGLEIVLQSNPVTSTGPGQPIVVQVQLDARPLADAQVSFIPRQQTLAAEFDEEFERMTNSIGEATFTPRSGDRYLIVVHHEAPDQSGANYDATAYSAAVTILVPEICPCCGSIAN
jgi:hypothetical protein